MDLLRFRSSGQRSLPDSYVQDYASDRLPSVTTSATLPPRVPLRVNESDLQPVISSRDMLYGPVNRDEVIHLMIISCEQQRRATCSIALRSNLGGLGVLQIKYLDHLLALAHPPHVIQNPRLRNSSIQGSQLNYHD